jgi:Holliday junction DNA helicase RuvA
VISSVRGTVLSISADSAVIEMGGLGVLVQCTQPTLATLSLGDIVMLPTSLVVREDSLTLYGFVDHDERSVFESVQTVSGIGPRIAQAMLAVLRPDDIRRAITSNELTTLTKVPGIGTKGAQRLVLELKDRLAPPTAIGSQPTGAGSSADWTDQVRAALVGLGWSARDADEAVEIVRRDVGDDVADVGALLRSALRSLDRS